LNYLIDCPPKRQARQAGILPCDIKQLVFDTDELIEIFEKQAEQVRVGERYLPFDHYFSGFF
jgi:hypothetical protein